MTIPETFANDLDRVVRGEDPAPTTDAEHTALLATAQRLSEGMRPLRQAPPGTQDRLEARLLAQLPVATHRRWKPALPLRPLRRWQTVVGLATAAALVLAIVSVAVSWGGSSGAVSAQVILDRAESAATGDAPSGVTSYHLKETRQIPAKGNVTINREVWYGGSDRQRADEQFTDARGAVVSTNGTVVNGAEAWLSYTENGQTRVVHTTGTAWTKPATSPEQGSVADAIAQYSKKGCMNAQQQGETMLLNRAVYVVILTPKADGCPDQYNKEDQAKIATAKIGRATADAKATATGNGAAKTDQKGGQDSGVGQMRLWVDKQTFIPLKTEVHSAAGAVLDRSDVTDIEYNIAIPASIFTYTPPAGATVTTFTGGDGRDVKAALSGDKRPNGTPEPVKKP